MVLIARHGSPRNPHPGYERIGPGVPSVYPTIQTLISCYFALALPFSTIRSKRGTPSFAQMKYLVNDHLRYRATVRTNK